MRLRVGAAAAGVVLVMAGVLSFSLAANPVVAGSNGIQPFSGTVFLKEGVRYCQQLPHLPAEVSRLKMLVLNATGGASALDVLVLDREGRIARGTLPQVRPGYVTVRLDRPTPKRGIRHAGVCFTNAGVGEIVLAGETKRCTPRDRGIGPAAPCLTAPGLHPPDQKFRWLVGVRYLRSGSTSWLSEANVILDRFGLAQAGWFGTWAAWVAGLLALLSAGVGLWWVAKGDESTP
jgi:hypothetical protein